MAKNSLQARGWPRRRVPAGLIVGTLCLGLIASACSSTPSATQASHGNIILNMWSTLSASDAQTWAKMIANFNAANNDKGLHEQIKMTTIANNYTTKVTAAVTAGRLPTSAGGPRARKLSGPSKG